MAPHEHPATKRITNPAEMLAALQIGSENTATTTQPPLSPSEKRFDQEFQSDHPNMGDKEKGNGGLHVIFAESEGDTTFNTTAQIKQARFPPYLEQFILNCLAQRASGEKDQAAFHLMNREFVDQCFTISREAIFLKAAHDHTFRFTLREVEKNQTYIFEVQLLLRQANPKTLEELEPTVDITYRQCMTATAPPKTLPSLVALSYRDTQRLNFMQTLVDAHFAAFQCEFELTQTSASWREALEDRATTAARALVKAWGATPRLGRLSSAETQPDSTPVTQRKPPAPTLHPASPTDEGDEGVAKVLTL